jgi:Sec-independent protein secretion pathway component TatC
MPLTSHLAELHGRLFIYVIVIAIAIGFAGCYALSEHFITALQSLPNLLGPSLTVSLQIIAPAEAFLTYLKVSFPCGLLLALPVILDQHRAMQRST